jgi:hypothetical protein
MQRGEAGLQWAAASPAGQGAMAVLGAIDNTIVGTEAAATGGGNVGDIARGAWQGLTQPGQATENVHTLEKNLHMPQPGLRPGATLPEHILQGAEDTGLQSQSLLIPGADVIGLAGKGLKALGTAGKLAGKAVPIIREVKGEVPNIIRYQQTASKVPEVSPRGGTFFGHGDEQALKDVKTDYNLGNQGVGGSHLVEQMQNESAKVYESNRGAAVGYLDKEHPDVYAHLNTYLGKKNTNRDLFARKALEDVIKDPAEIDKVMAFAHKTGAIADATHTGIDEFRSTIIDRVAAELAKKDGYDALKGTDEFFALSPKAHRVALEAVKAKNLGDVLKASGPVKAVAKLAGGVAKSAVVDKTVGYFDADHILNKIVTPKGNAVFKGLSAMKKTMPDGEIKPMYTPKQIGDIMEAKYKGEIKDPQPGAIENHAALQLGAATAEAALKKNPLANMNPGKYVSNLQRAALFVLPFAHMKNLTVLAALGPGGISTVAKGVKYARLISKGDRATLARVDSLKAIGAGAEYHTAGTFNSAAGGLGKIPVVGKRLDTLSAKSTKILTDYDNGLRLALHDKLKQKGIGDFEAGGQIRDVMGDYGNQSQLVKHMKNIGANFPAWRMGVVPKAMFKAVREQPKATNLYSRIQSNITNDVVGPMLPGSKGNTTGFDTGGPAELGAQEANPLGLAKAMASPSTMGPLGEVPGFVNAMSNHNVANWAKGEAEKFIPFGSIIQKIPAFNPWAGKETHPLTSAALSLAGMYTVDLPKLNNRMQTEKRSGLKGKPLFDQMVAEGLMRPGKKPSAAPAATSTSARGPEDYFK